MTKCQPGQRIQYKTGLGDTHECVGIVAHVSTYNHDPNRDDIRVIPENAQGFSPAHWVEGDRVMKVLGDYTMYPPEQMAKLLVEVHNTMADVNASLDHAEYNVGVLSTRLASIAECFFPNRHSPETMALEQPRTLNLEEL